MDFRTRRKDGVVFPIGNEKQYRRVDDYEPELDDPGDEDYDLQLQVEEARKEELKQEQREKEKKLRKLENPSFSSRIDTKGDVKKLMRANDSQVNKEKNFEKYKTRLNRDMELTYIKEDQRADKRRERAINKAEKLQEKSIKLEQKSQQIKGEYK
jgi:hypothetical protein